MTELLKALHISAIAMWSAGLLCLPSLYVQRRHVVDDALHRLQKMVRYAYIAIVSPCAFVAVATGTALIFTESTYQPWFAVKLGFVGVMSFLHVLTGLVVIRLFREGARYPAWRFVTATVITGVTITAILWTVLAKPDMPGLPTGLFRPGALGEALAPLNPWTTP